MLMARRLRVLERHILMRARCLVLLIVLAVCVGGALFLAGCGSGSTAVNPLGPSDARCGVTAAVSNSSIEATGGTGTLKITTARECRWSVSTGAAWIRFTSEAEGQGPAEVSFAVDSNRSTEARRVELVVADQRVAISQSAATCTWKVTPDAVAVGSSGGEVRATLATEDYCSWTLSPRVQWIEITPAMRGVGPTDISLRISSNAGPARTGSVEFPSGVIAVSQKEAPVTSAPVPEPAPGPAVPLPPAPVPCTFQVAPTEFNDVSFSASPLQVDVTTQTGCAWSAASNTTWVTISSGTDGIGSGHIQLSVAENTGAARSGTLVIAGKTVTVNQLSPQAPPPPPPPPPPVPCTFQVAPTEFNDVGFSGTSLQADVTTQTGCTWSSASNATWVTISSGSTGTGSGRVQLSVAENTGATRSGTLVIAGQTVTVNQQSRPACAYTINPGSYNPSSTGGSIAVAVTTTADCDWAVTGNPAWVSASPSSATGGGTTTITVQSNSGAARSATFKIAGRDFAVQQASAPCTYLSGPTSRTIPAYPTTTREIGITTQAHCPVAAAVSVPWLEIIYAPTFGSGEIGIRIYENTGEQRSGTVTVTGENFILVVTFIQVGRN